MSWRLDCLDHVWTSWFCVDYENAICLSLAFAGTIWSHPSSLVGGLQKLVSFFHSRSLITKSWSVPWVDCEGKGCLQLENVENISSLLLSQWASICAYSAAHKICIWIYYHIWPGYLARKLFISCHSPVVCGSSSICALCSIVKACTDYLLCQHPLQSLQLLN